MIQPWCIIPMALLAIAIVVLNDLSKRRLVQKAERAGRKPRSEWKNNKIPWEVVLLFVTGAGASASVFVLFPEHPDPNRLALKVFFGAPFAMLSVKFVWSVCRPKSGLVTAPKPSSADAVGTFFDDARWDAAGTIRFQGPNTRAELWHALQLARTPARPFISAGIVLVLLLAVIGRIAESYRTPLSGHGMLFSVSYSSWPSCIACFRDFSSVR